MTVDGEAAAEASSYSDLEGAIGSDTSKFLVRQQSSAQASADVLVAVNQFSTREITMSEDGSDNEDSDGSGSDSTDSSDEGTTTTDDDSGTTATNGPGFGPVVALSALVAVAVLALARRRSSKH